MGFVYQFHFLLGVIIFQENVTMWNGVAMNGMWVGHFAFFAFVFVFQLLHCLNACSRNGLIGGNNYAFNPECTVNGRKCHHHLNGRAVRVGNNFVWSRQFIGINFGNDKLMIGMHPPSRGIVNNCTTNGSKLWCPSQWGIAASRKQGNIWLLGNGIFHGDNGTILAVIR